MGIFLKQYKVVISFLVVILIVSFAYSIVVAVRTSRFNGFTIVIDAGHGGLDVK